MPAIDLKPFLLDPARQLEAAAADLQHVLNLCCDITAAERRALLSLCPSVQPLLSRLQADDGEMPVTGLSAEAAALVFPNGGVRRISPQ